MPDQKYNNLIGENNFPKDNNLINSERNFPKDNNLINSMIKSSENPFLYNISVKIIKEINLIHRLNPRISLDNLQNIVENPCDWVYDNNFEGFHNVKDGLCLPITLKDSENLMDLISKFVVNLRRYNYSKNLMSRSETNLRY